MPRLIVGVTGHRDIPPGQVPAIAALVNDAFGRLKEEFASELIVLSALAEGADRIAALCAQDRSIPFKVPLPFTPAEYEKDFESKESIMQFRQLLAHADQVFVVSEEMIALGPANDHLDPRLAGYRRVGKYLARCSHILLALWDGHAGGKTGGTWEVVNEKISAQNCLDWPASFRNLQEEGIVLQIATPRRENTSHIQPSLEWPSPAHRAWKTLREAIASEH